MAIDVVPTIAELLGLELTWDSDGAPIGSPEIAARGDAKVWYDIRSPFFPRLEGVIEFDGVANFPRADDRWIGPLTDADVPLAGLDELLDVDDVLGSPLGDLGDVNPLSIEIDRLDDLRRPESDEPALGVVTGRVPGAPSDAVVVLAVDGTFVAGSKLAVDSAGRDGRFAMLLPPGVLDAQNEIRAALDVDGELFELDVD